MSFSTQSLVLVQSTNSKYIIQQVIKNKWIQPESHSKTTDWQISKGTYRREQQ